MWCAAGAPAAKRGGMFGGRKHDESAVAAGGHGGKFKLNAGAKTGLLIAELLTLLVSVPCLQQTALPPLVSCAQRGAVSCALV